MNTQPQPLPTSEQGLALSQMYEFNVEAMKNDGLLIESEYGLVWTSDGLHAASLVRPPSPSSKRAFVGNREVKL